MHSSVTLRSILCFGDSSSLYPCFLNSSTDKMSPNSQTFSSPYQTLTEWWASCRSPHQTLASEDYETGRDRRPLTCSRPLFLQAAAPIASHLSWKGTCSSKHPFNKYLTLVLGLVSLHLVECCKQQVLTLWSSLPSRTTSPWKMKGCQTKWGKLFICAHVKLNSEVGVCCFQLKEFLLYTKWSLLSLELLIFFHSYNWELVFTNLILSDCSRQKGSLSLFIQHK